MHYVALWDNNSSSIKYELNKHFQSQCNSGNTISYMQ